MSDYSVDCGIHGEVLEVGGECSVCTLVERNRLAKEVEDITEEKELWRKLAGERGLEVEALKAEVARLVFKDETAVLQIITAVKRAEKAEAERDRLREDAQSADGAFQTLMNIGDTLRSRGFVADIHNSVDQRVIEMAQSCDRLREVLVSIHNVDDSEWVNNRIDDALNHKETLLKCKGCGTVKNVNDIMPPDTCSCGHGWGGAINHKEW